MLFHPNMMVATNKMPIFFNKFIYFKKKELIAGSTHYAKLRSNDKVAIVASS